MGRNDRLPVVTLVALPALVFGIPALAGHPVLTGDDLTQNEPLRVFVGQLVRHGHLPLFDPYIWSGAPLLGGWNAGAAYPFTMFFAVLPATAAWTLNLMLVWWVAGLGTYAFARASRLGPTPALAGALSFAFAGAFTAQLPHFGLVAGMSWVPLQLLGVLRSTEHPETAEGTSAPAVPGRALWVASIAVALAMTILAGEPRSITSAVLVVGPYALWRVARSGRAALRSAGAVLGGVVLGAALGALQLLPGIEAVHSSQRSTGSAYLFTSGSLPIHWLVLLAVPDALGGSGSFSQPQFLGAYNLTEVTGYVGVLPLVAAGSLLASLWWRRGRVAVGGGLGRLPEWAVWSVVALLGIVLALGGNTPLWHLLIRVPLFGGQRLQSRNLIVSDFALAMLLAWWAELFVSRARGPADRRSTTGGLLGAAVPVVLASLALAWCAGFLRWLGPTPRALDQAGSLRPYMAIPLVLGLAAAALVVLGPRCARETRRRLVLGLVAVDIGIFTLTAVVAVDQGSITPVVPVDSATRTTSTPKPATAVPPPRPTVPLSVLAGNGRFALYDPNLLYGGQLTFLGVPDLNVVTGTPSVGGYGSIVDGSYAEATGTHTATGQGQDLFDPAAVDDGVFDQLGVTVLLAPQDYFLTVPGGVGPGPAGSGRRVVSAGATTTWSFGGTVAVTEVAVPGAGAPGTRLGLVRASGAVTWFSAAAGLARMRSPVSATALVASAPPGSGATFGPPSLTSDDGQRYQVDGQLVDVVVPPHWAYRGHDGSFAVFANVLVRPALGLLALPGHGLAGASVRPLGGHSYAPDAAAVSSPAGVVVTRAVAAVPGWQATYTPSGPGSHDVVALEVHRKGVLQAVDVPAGRGVLRWTYRAPGIGAGWAVAAGGAFVLVALLAGPALRRRRIRGHRLRGGRRAVRRAARLAVWRRGPDNARG